MSSCGTNGNYIMVEVGVKLEKRESILYLSRPHLVRGRGKPDLRPAWVLLLHGRLLHGLHVGPHAWRKRLAELRIDHIRRLVRHAALLTLVFGS